MTNGELARAWVDLMLAKHMTLEEMDDRLTLLGLQGVPPEYSDLWDACMAEVQGRMQPTSVPIAVVNWPQFAEVTGG